MSAPGPAALTVLRGNPTPEELASLLVVFAALRGGGPDREERAPGAGRGWGRPVGWHHAPIGAHPDAMVWQRTHVPTYERTS